MVHTKVLITRALKYRNLDIRPDQGVDYCQDLIEGTDFKDKEWDWVGVQKHWNTYHKNIRKNL